MLWHAVRPWVGLVLVLALFYPAHQVRFHSLRALRPGPVIGSEVPQLDSFSEPGVAVAVLEQYVQDLSLSCIMDTQPLSKNLWSREFSAKPLGKFASISGGLPAHGQTRFDPKSTPALASEDLHHLRDRLHGLEGDLLENLLTIQFERQAWSDFLDAYLELLTVSPDRSVIVTWTRWALMCSRQCGRTDEVVHALEHSIHFGKNQKTAARLQRVLREWNRGRLDSVAAFGPSIPNRTDLCQPSTPAER